MDIPGGPAALGGLMMGVGLAAWAVGRWQGAAMAVLDRAAAATGGPAARLAPAVGLPHAPARPSCHCAACARADYRGEELASARALGAMHDEISAYRRAQQILSDLSGDALNRIAVPVGTGENDRIRAADSPAVADNGAFTDSASRHCHAACRHKARAALPERGDYRPVDVPAGLTRV